MDSLGIELKRSDRYDFHFGRNMYKREPSLLTFSGIFAMV